MHVPGRAEEQAAHGLVQEGFWGVQQGRAMRWCARWEQLQCMYPAALSSRLHMALSSRVYWGVEQGRAMRWCARWEQLQCMYPAALRSRLHMALSSARGLCSSSCATVSIRLVPVPRLAARPAAAQASFPNAFLRQHLLVVR